MRDDTDITPEILQPPILEGDNRDSSEPEPAARDNGADADGEPSLAARSSAAHRQHESLNTQSEIAPDLSILIPAIPRGPDLPLELLPPRWQDVVTSVTASRLTHPGFVLTAMAATIAGTVGTAAYLQVGGAEREPCSLFALNIGAKSTGKSVAHDATATLLMEICADTFSKTSARGRRLVDQIVEKEQERQLRRTVRRGVERGNADFSALYENQSGSASDRVPSLRVCSDLSLPGIIEQLQGSPHGLLLSHHEVRALIQGSTMRSPEGRAFLLQGYDGGPYIKTRHGSVTFIPALQMSLCGGTQPDRVSQVLGGQDDGLISRCLIAYPQIERRSGGLDRNVAYPPEFRQLLGALLELAPGKGSFAGHPVQLSAHGWRALEVAERRWTGLATAVGDGVLSSAYARVRQNALRLALVLEIGEHALAGKPGLPGYVTDTAMRAAIGLMDTFFIPSAERALAHLRLGEDKDVALRQIARFIALKADVYGAFNLRELYQSPQAPFPRDARIWTEVTEHLRLAHCVSRASRKVRDGRRRGDWVAHPVFLTRARNLP